MRLRQEVFVVEQNCPYLDCDGKDISAHHLLAYLDTTLIGCTRMLPKGVAYQNYASIGRVIAAENHRSTGLGKKIMEASIAHMKEIWPMQNIKISSQVYALAFYKKFGFVPTGKPYLEDDIPHQAMILEF